MISIIALAVLSAFAFEYFDGGSAIRNYIAGSGRVQGQTHDRTLPRELRRVRDFCTEFDEAIHPRLVEQAGQAIEPVGCVVHDAFRVCRAMKDGGRPSVHVLERLKHVSYRDAAYCRSWSGSTKELKGRAKLDLSMLEDLNLVTSEQRRTWQKALYPRDDRMEGEWAPSPVASRISFGRSAARPGSENGRDGVTRPAERPGSGDQGMRGDLEQSNGRDFISRGASIIKDLFAGSATSEKEIVEEWSNIEGALLGRKSAINFVEIQSHVADYCDYVARFKKEVEVYSSPDGQTLRPLVGALFASDSALSQIDSACADPVAHDSAATFDDYIMSVTARRSRSLAIRSILELLSGKCSHERLRNIEQQHSYGLSPNVKNCEDILRIVQLR